MREVYVWTEFHPLDRQGFIVHAKVQPRLCPFCNGDPVKFKRLPNLHFKQWQYYFECEKGHQYTQLIDKEI
jgi:hypothetical protein